MPTLLLELFSEEIPARMQKKAAQDLYVLLEKELKTAGLPFKHDGRNLSAPRRLAIILNDLPAAQPDVSVELKGPKADAPQAALEGFLKKNNLTLDKLENRSGIYFASIHTKGRQTAEVLKEIIEETLREFPWPKSMRWGSNDETWVRPLHSILCIFDDKVVPVQFGPVKAGDPTYGHRFLSPAAITIKNASEYETALEKANVIVDRAKRRDMIEAAAKELAAKLGCSLKTDEALLEEVVGLVEWPVMLAGNIDGPFMELPPEVLTTVMRSHQKYFALEKDGKLSSHFIFAANRTTSDGGKAVIAGNERVLRARLSDAKFFWEQDRKKKLDEWNNGLSGVVFHAKIGTIAEKVERIKILALKIAEFVSQADTKQVERAAALCKADLVTGMVGEFAELQGIMGRYYALHQGEDAAVVDAICDHYKPQGPNDSIPTAPVSICVALADKLDTLISMFAIGEKPTGSKDPYALRRAALGIIRIILENRLRLNLKQLGLSDELLAFFLERLKVSLKEEGIAHDVINAALSKQMEGDFTKLVLKVQALQSLLSSADGENLLTAYRRAANILEIEQKKDKATYAPDQLKTELLKEAEEKALHTALSEKAKVISALLTEEKFTEAMQQFATLRTPLDAFFDKILVNAEDKILRTNRLALLASIKQTMGEVADFSAIEK